MRQARGMLSNPKGMRPQPAVMQKIAPSTYQNTAMRAPQPMQLQQPAPGTMPTPPSQAQALRPIIQQPQQFIPRGGM